MSSAVLEELYEDVKEDMERICRGFARRKHRDPDEILTEGNYYFLLCCQNYVPARGDFSNWLRFYVGKMLIEEARKIAKKNKKRRIVDMSRLPAKKAFSLSMLMTDVSPDARYVMRLALNQFDASPASIRKKLKQFLGRVGWSSSRIAKAFNEVGDAL